MINRKFLYFKTLAGFEAALIDRGDDRTGIRQDSIVFIGQEKLIWNRGVFYGKGEHKDERSKGLFSSEDQLLQTVPLPVKGDWAFVKVGEKYYIYLCEINGVWVNSGSEYSMGITRDEIEQMFRWYTQDQDDLISGLQASISSVDSKYGGAVKDINDILNALPKNFVTPDNISDYLPESSTIPEGVITQDNINDYIPDNIITSDNIGDYITQQDIITVDSELSESSINPVQNAVIYAALQQKVNASQIKDWALRSDLQTYQDILSGKANLSDYEGWLDYLRGLSDEIDDKVDSDYAEDTYAKKGEITQQVTQEVNTYVTEILQTAEHSKGYFSSESELNEEVPNPESGDWAIVSVDGVWMVYKCNTDGEWESTGQEFEFDIDLNGYATKNDIKDLANKSQITQLSNQINDKLDKSTYQSHLEYAEGTYAKKGDVVQQITQIIQSKEHAKGYFDSEAELIEEVPNPESGDWAIVAVNNKWIVYRCNDEGQWASTGQEFTFDINLSTYAKKSELNDLLPKTDFLLFKQGLTSDLADIEGEIAGINTTLAGLDTTSGLQEHERYAEQTYAKKGEVSQQVTQEVHNHVTEIVKTAEKAKGYFDTEQELNQTIPQPEVGDWAIVKVNNQWIVFRCATAGTWQSTGEPYTPSAPDLTLYAKTQDIQDTYATKADLTSHINTAASTYLTQNDLNGYAKLDDIPQDYGTGDVTQQDLLLYTKVSDFNTYKDNVALTYAKKDDLTGLLTQNDLTGLATLIYVDSKVTDLTNRINAISKVGTDNKDLTDFLTELQNRVQYLYNKYISWLLQGDEEPGGDTPVPDIPNTPDNPVTPVTNNNMITLTESAYQALVETGEVNPNTYYFTYVEEEQEEPSSDTTWHFGDAFPIIFNDKWEFGNNFPIILTEQWTFGGAFPIKLT